MTFSMSIMRGKGRQAWASLRGANDRTADNKTVIDVAPLTMTAEATGDGLCQTQRDSVEKVRVHTQCRYRFEEMCIILLH